MLACLVGVLAVPVPAQVMELAGGTSTLYQATGASFTVRGRNYEGSVGTGVIAGRFVGGGKFAIHKGDAIFAAGREVIPFDLPTDVFDDYHVMYAMGASAQIKWDGSDFFAFGGVASQVYESPFFEGMSALYPAIVVRGSQAFGAQSRWKVSAEGMMAEKSTAIGSVAWRAAKGLNFAVSGGEGAGSPYAAASMDLQSKKLDVKAAYISTGSSFRRLDDDTLQGPEPVDGNVSVTWRPWSFLSVSGGQQNYAMPLTCTTTGPSGDSDIGPCQTTKSRVDQISVNARVGGVGMSAAEFQSNYNGNGNESRVFSAERDFGRRWKGMASYLMSRFDGGEWTSDIIGTVQETVTNRLSLNETVTDSNGQRSMGFGGGWLSNLATVNVDYETYYVAARPDHPFEDALIASVQLNLGSGVSLHGETFVAPDGRLLYTADARAQEVRGAAPGSRQTGMGVMEMHGRVVDQNGRPVEGAALMINQMPVYTGEDGSFSVRERHRRSHPLTVLGGQFLDGREYRVVSAPESIHSGEGEDDVPVTIVVAEVGGNR
jgi:hypothetical protein